MDPNSTDTIDTETPTVSSTAPTTASGAPATSTVAASSAPPQPDTTNLPIASDATQKTASSVVPVPVKPVRRSGLAGVVDEIRDALAGGQSESKVYEDAQGNKYVGRFPMSHGQQWARIASEALHGAAAGFAAGKGGNPGAALAAGVGAGDKMAAERKANEKEMSQEAQQANLNKFNNTKLKLDLAASEFAFTRTKVQATREEIEFAQQQIDREKALNSADLGTYENAVDLADVKKKHPDFWKDVYGGRIVAVPNVAADGTRKGIHLFLRTEDVGNQLVDSGTQVLDYQAPTKPGEQPQLTKRTLAGPTTHRQLDDWNNAALTKYQKWFADQQKLKDDEAERKLREEEARTQQTEQTKNKAQAREADAAGREADAKAAVDKAKAGDDSTLIDMIGTGRMPAGRLSYIMSRNPALLDAVGQRYPDFDGAKVDGYSKVVADYESTHRGSTGAALNAGATALKHLRELRDLNTTKSHIPGTAEYNAYQNKADTLATELAAFYGDTTIPAIASIKKTLTSQLPGTRQKAIETQAQSMGDKLDSFEQSWREAAPSKVYEAQMPQIDDKAKDARAELDPKYKERRVAELQGHPPAPAPAPTAAPSGKGVSLKAAMQLPENHGKSAEQVTADIKAHGHTVLP